MMFCACQAGSSRLGTRKMRVVVSAAVLVGSVSRGSVSLLVITSRATGCDNNGAGRAASWW